MRAHIVRVAVSAAAIAAATLLVWALTPIAPNVSLGAIYILPVLAAAIVGGIGYALATAIASQLVFNFFFLPPVHTLSLAHERDWTALAVYLVTGVVAGELANRARRRAAEAEARERGAALLADLGARLLEGSDASELLAQVDPHDTRHVAAVDALVAIADERARLQDEALEAEALRRTDAVKTAVIRSVSHDLRTPLATIRAALDGLDGRDVALDEQDRELLLASLRGELARLEGVVENLLDLSRLQAGAATPSLELWSPDDLVARALAERGDERVAVSLPAGLRPVRADAAQVQRALVNLLDNALKFSPPTAPVTLRAVSAGDEVVFRVEDEGPGVPDEDVAAIFEPFRRSSGSRGAGLGLAIARGFATANGGRLWAERSPAGGAVFALALPAEELPAPVAR
jgi:two-component system sensor histidine kinase KdpD